MTALLKGATRGNLAPLRDKLRCLGVHDEDDLDIILSRIEIGPCFPRGQDILPAGSSPKHSTVILGGVACLYERLNDGGRQIYSFQYPGDFCDLSLHVPEATTPSVAIAAATDCRIGSIDNQALDRLLEEYPSFGLALWRSTFLEATALRARLLNRRKTALEYIAHLLCELLARRSAAGIDDMVIPVCQVELADAAGLSVVHINRTFKELLCMGLLTKDKRSMKVANRAGLARLADFDGHYLDMPTLLARWDVKMPTHWNMKHPGC